MSFARLLRPGPATASRFRALATRRRLPGRTPARLLTLGLVAVLAAGCVPQDRPLRVFSAASLTDVMDVLADSFAARGTPVVVNVAGSSLLARQIDRGAAADVYVSAHPDWTDYLEERGRIEPAVQLPISNRLVEVRRPGDEANDGRLALADPEHVPAGLYAREALTCEGRWADVADRIVPTIDVRAAVAAVQTGAAAVAIVYASDALFAPELEVREVFSEGCRPEIRYTAAVVKNSARAREAGRFLELMQDPDMMALWRRYGFTEYEAR